MDLRPIATCRTARPCNKLVTALRSDWSRILLDFRRRQGATPNSVATTLETAHPCVGPEHAGGKEIDSLGRIAPELINLHVSIRTTIASW